MIEPVMQQPEIKYTREKKGSHVTQGEPPEAKPESIFFLAILYHLILVELLGFSEVS